MSNSNGSTIKKYNSKTTLPDGNLKPGVAKQGGNAEYTDTGTGTKNQNNTTP